MIDSRYKWCSHCARVAIKSAFTINNQNTDGLSTHCKPCNKIKFNRIRPPVITRVQKKVLSNIKSELKVQPPVRHQLYLNSKRARRAKFNLESGTDSRHLTLLQDTGGEILLAHTSDPKKRAKWLNQKLDLKLTPVVVFNENDSQQLSMSELCVELDLHIRTLVDAKGEKHWVDQWYRKSVDDLLNRLRALGIKCAIYIK